MVKFQLSEVVVAESTQPIVRHTLHSLILIWEHFNSLN